MRVERFDPPADLSDFDLVAGQRAAWHEYVKAQFQEGIARAEDLVGQGNAQFFDPSDTESPDGATAMKAISWPGFPNTLNVEAEDALADAEKLRVLMMGGQHRMVDEAHRPVQLLYRPQDEYLEWRTERDQNGKISRVTFTCEPPEYWESLAQGYPVSFSGQGTSSKGSPELLLVLYRALVSPQVELADLLFKEPVRDLRTGLLYKAGQYNPWNVWNTRQGIVHLTHPSNTLGAEINLAADGSVLRVGRGGTAITEAKRLICCAAYGVATRFSDPKIGAEVNALARSDVGDGRSVKVSLANPVGLYMRELDTAGWRTPNGRPAGDFFQIARGYEDRENPDRSKILRAVFEVPHEEGYSVGDILIGEHPIQQGGQIAKHITMQLVGTAFEADVSRANRRAARRIAAPHPSISNA